MPMDNRVIPMERQASNWPRVTSSGLASKVISRHADASGKKAPSNRLSPEAGNKEGVPPPK